MEPSLTYSEEKSYELKVYILFLDLRDSLVSHGFYATEKEIQLIMSKFDKFSDNKVTMTDFIDEMVPKTRA